MRFEACWSAGSGLGRRKCMRSGAEVADRVDRGLKCRAGLVKDDGLLERSDAGSESWLIAR